jgi:hypothetical protein
MLQGVIVDKRKAFDLGFQTTLAGYRDKPKVDCVCRKVIELGCLLHLDCILEVRDGLVSSGLDVEGLPILDAMYVASEG